jgi:aminopeptidase N
MKYIFILISFITFGQQSQKVDFKTATGFVNINPIERKVSGNATYEFTVLDAVDTIRIDAKNMRFASVMINKTMVKYVNTTRELLLFEGFKKGKNKVSFEFSAYPKQTLYFNGDFGCESCENQQVWTQGQGKYTSHWFPSFDDVNEKMVFRLNLSFDSRYTAISNGKLKGKTDNLIGNYAHQQQTWQYSMDKPMSSYLLMVAIGKFEKSKQRSETGVALEFYYQSKDKEMVSFTYYKSKEVFDFLEREIGVAYPWELYRQVPVEDFLYAGMENTTSTIFAQDFVVDSIGFNDRNYVNVNAHELAHQWFGDMVTATSGKHHWLQEGFATYYALLTEKAIFGEDYFYYKLYQTSLQLKVAAKTDTIPVMHEKASSLSFYQKGAWALHVIRERIGAKAFQLAVKNYLVTYAYKNVETEDFLAEIRKVSDFDTENFRKQWLQDYVFNTKEVNDLLNKNLFIKQLVKVQKMRDLPLKERLEEYNSIMKSDAYYPVKTEILYQLKEEDFADKKEVLTSALQTNAIKVRQAVAEFVGAIPLEFKATYETLLNDDSYETREIAFMTLWKNFPDNRLQYLEQVKHWVGMNDKALRIMYLSFYLLSPDTDSLVKTKYYSELVNYTSSSYESSVRENAISSALMIAPYDTSVLRNLVNATTHQKWQFVKFAKQKIRELLLLPDYRLAFESLLPMLSANDQLQLKRLLEEK